MSYKKLSLNSLSAGQTRRNKLRGFGFYVSFLLLIWCQQAQHIAAQTQDYNLSTDEFSVTMPGKPEYDKQFSDVYAAYDGYRVIKNDVHYLVLLKSLRKSERTGYEYQLLSLKGHTIGYNAGFIKESNRKGENVDIVLDRDFRLNGFPARQYRIVSNALTGVLRFYSTDRFVYTLQVLGATSQDVDVKQFFDSFKLRRPGQRNIK